jgi:hypothetical protein
MQYGCQIQTWSSLAILIPSAAAGIGLSAPMAKAQAGVDIGLAPDCPYGYFDVAPYDCAPAGYYGPEWCGLLPGESPFIFRFRFEGD